MEFESITRKVAKTAFRGIQDGIDLVNTTICHSNLFFETYYAKGYGWFYNNITIEETGDPVVETTGYCGIAISKVELLDIAGYNNGFEEDKIAMGYDAFEDINNDDMGDIDFCTSYLLKVDVVLDGKSEEFGMMPGVEIKFSYPLYVYDFKRKENGFTIKVCTKEDLPKYNEMVANLIDTYYDD